MLQSQKKTHLLTRNSFTMSPLLPSIFKKSFLFLIKKPYYILFGALFTIGIWFPLSFKVNISDQKTPLLKDSFVQTLSNSSDSYQYMALFIFLALLFLWLLKIFFLSLTYLGILSNKEKKYTFSILKSIRTTLLSFPALISSRILFYLSLFLVFVFLTLPVAMLIDAHSFYGSWFLGILAIAFFFYIGLRLLSVLLFSQCFILFSSLSLKEALHASFRLYEKKQRESFSFFFLFLILFLFIEIIIPFFPGFCLSENLFIFPLYSEYPLSVNILGFFFSYCILSLYFTFFTISFTFFFLQIARQPKKKKVLIQEVETFSSPLLKKKTETLSE